MKGWPSIHWCLQYYVFTINSTYFNARRGQISATLCPRHHLKEEGGWIGNKHMGHSLGWCYHTIYIYAFEGRVIQLMHNCAACLRGQGIHTVGPGRLPGTPSHWRAHLQISLQPLINVSHPWCMPAAPGDICRGPRVHAHYPITLEIESASPEAKLQPLVTASHPWHPPHRWAWCCWAVPGPLPQPDRQVAGPGPANLH